MTTASKYPPKATILRLVKNGISASLVADWVRFAAVKGPQGDLPFSTQMLLERAEDDTDLAYAEALCRVPVRKNLRGTTLDGHLRKHGTPGDRLAIARGGTPTMRENLADDLRGTDLLETFLELVKHEDTAWITLQDEHVPREAIVAALEIPAAAASLRVAPRTVAFDVGLVRQIAETCPAPQEVLGTWIDAFGRERRTIEHTLSNMRKRTLEDSSSGLTDRIAVLEHHLDVALNAASSLLIDLCTTAGDNVMNWSALKPFASDHLDLRVRRLLEQHQSGAPLTDEQALGLMRIASADGLSDDVAIQVAWILTGQHGAFLNSTNLLCATGYGVVTSPGNAAYWLTWAERAAVADTRNDEAACRWLLETFNHIVTHWADYPAGHMPGGHTLLAARLERVRSAHWNAPAHFGRDTERGAFRPIPGLIATRSNSPGDPA